MCMCLPFSTSSVEDLQPNKVLLFTVLNPQYPINVVSTAHCSFHRVVRGLTFTRVHGGILDEPSAAACLLVIGQLCGRTGTPNRVGDWGVCHFVSPQRNSPEGTSVFPLDRKSVMTGVENTFLE